MAEDGTVDDAGTAADWPVIRMIQVLMMLDRIGQAIRLHGQQLLGHRRILAEGRRRRRRFFAFGIDFVRHFVVVAAGILVQELFELLQLDSAKHGRVVIQKIQTVVWIFFQPVETDKSSNNNFKKASKSIGSIGSVL